MLMAVLCAESSGIANAQPLDGVMQFPEIAEAQIYHPSLQGLIHAPTYAPTNILTHKLTQVPKCAHANTCMCVHPCTHSSTHYVTTHGLTLAPTSTHICTHASAHVHVPSQVPMHALTHPCKHSHLYSQYTHRPTHSPTQVPIQALLGPAAPEGRRPRQALACPLGLEGGMVVMARGCLLVGYPRP